MGQGQLEAVALGPGVPVSACGRGAVGGRVDVGAARQHQAVEQVEHLVGRLGGGVVGRQQQRHAAGALHRVA